MSDPTEQRSGSEQPMYIVCVLLFVAMMWCLQLVIPAGLYCAIYGVPSMEGLFSEQVPDYSHAALWKGRVWYSVVKYGPNNFDNKGTLMSLDPVTGDTSESKFQIPTPVSGLLADGDRLWAIAQNSVVRIEGDQTTEFKPKRLLIQPCEPFIFEDRVAVVDIAANGTPTLLVLQNNEWVELGILSAPYGSESTIVEGKPVLVPSAAKSTAGVETPEFKVVTHAGRTHVFFCDGGFIAYRVGIELAPASALAPANVFGVPDLGDLEGWEVVSRVSSEIGIGVSDHFRIGLIEGEPVVLTIDSIHPNPFQGVSVMAYRRVDGMWQKTAERPIAGTNALLTVSDGQKTYAAGQSITQILKFDEVTETEIRPTGAVLKAPVAPMQQPMERWGQLSQWVYWPTLLLLGLGVGWLMTIYRDASYQFGLTDVELASITRRGIARVIDYFLYAIPIYLLFLAFGFSSQEPIALDLDQLFDAGPEGKLVRFVWLAFGSLLLGLSILIVNSVFQGSWGVTLGKWACGIRTVRTTLRPCGFLRAMLRELLILGDTLFMMTWLPATLLIAFTSCRQRLGDMVADTIVIRKPISDRPTVSGSFDAHQI